MANGQFAPGVRGLLQNIALQRLQERSRARDPLRQLQALQLEQQIEQSEESFPVTQAGIIAKRKEDAAEAKRKKAKAPFELDKIITEAEQTEVNLEKSEIELSKTARTQEEEVRRFQEKERFLTDQRIRLKEIPSVVKHISTDPKTGKTTFPAIPENTRQAMMGQMFEQIKGEFGQVKGEGFLGALSGGRFGTGEIEEEDLNEMLNTGNFPPGLSPRAENLIRAYSLIRDRADIAARASNAPPEIQELLTGAISALSLPGKGPQEEAGFTEQEQVNIDALIGAGFTQEEAEAAQIGKRKK